MRVKVIGAGSIGNHMAHASRTLGWQVTVTDVSEEALRRMRDEIYPARYGAWDEAIVQTLGGGTEDHDLVIIGTPPDHHLPLALTALAQSPRGILIEKPLCPPSLEGLDALCEAAARSGAKIFVGYDHVVGSAAREVERLLREGAIGDVLTLDVEFREHWAGIFTAHPWLRGPEDTYLGFTNRGGGASGEHSHALNLWQHFAHAAGGGRVAEVSAMLHYVSAGEAEYDDLCFLTLRTERGLTGRVVQDVVTLPPRKRALIQGTRGALEWVNGYDAQGDAVLLRRQGEGEEARRFPKRRADDFIEELKHVAAHLEPGSAPSPIGLDRGADTMLVLAAAHQAEREGRRERLAYGSWPRPEASISFDDTLTR